MTEPQLIQVTNYLSSNAPVLLGAWSKYQSTYKVHGGDYPTTWASINGHTDVLKYMCSIGCRIQNKASIRTAACGQLACLQYIRECSDLGLCPWDLTSCGNWAASNGDLPMLQYLEETNDVERWRNKDSTLKLACTSGNLEACIYLRDHGHALNKELCRRTLDGIASTNRTKQYPRYEIIKRTLCL